MYGSTLNVLFHQGTIGINKDVQEDLYSFLIRKTGSLWSLQNKTIPDSVPL
jgi:hypothetical protein